MSTTTPSVSSTDPVKAAIKSLKKWIPVKKLTISKRGGAVMPNETMIAMWTMTLLFIVPTILYIHDKIAKNIDVPRQNVQAVSNTAPVQLTSSELRTINGHPECQGVDFQINGSTRVRATDELKQLPGSYRFLMHGNHFTVKTDGGLVQACGGNVYPTPPTTDLESGLNVNGQGTFTICKCN